MDAWMWGAGDVLNMYPVGVSHELSAACSFRLSIAVTPSVQADSGSSGEEEDTLEIEVECQFTSASPNRYSSDYQKTLILSARGLNDFALGRLGTQDTKVVFHQTWTPDARAPRVVEQDEALLALIARALDLHREPDENPRFYGALSADAMTEEDEEDDEAQEEDLEAPVEMWDAKRVAHFLALCCFTPTNTYAQGHGPEEDFLVGFTPRYRHLKHPKKQLVYLLDDLANPDQMEGGFNP